MRWLAVAGSQTSAPSPRPVAEQCREVFRGSLHGFFRAFAQRAVGLEALLRARPR